MEIEENKIMEENVQVIKGKVDWRGKPARKDKHGGVGASISISAMFGFEAMVANALASNLIMYFNGVMHMKSAKAANQLTTYLGTNFCLTIVLAVLADAYVGRLPTILISATIVFVGVGLLGLQAHFPNLKPPPCNNLDNDSNCTSVQGTNATLLNVALYMVGIGSGGVKAALPAHGADQFDDSDPKEVRQKSGYFNWLLVASSCGNIIAATVIIWIQDNKGWDWGFGACAIAMLLGVIIFAIELPVYRIHAPNGTSILTQIARVVVSAINNRKLQLPEDSNELYDPNNDDNEDTKPKEHLPHTNTFRFLDKAAIQTPSSRNSPSPWKLCTVKQVETLKILLNMLPIFLCSTIMTLCLAQLQTFSVEQALTMDLSITKNFQMPPGSLAVIPFTTLVIITPIYDRILVPFMRRFTGIPTGITYLQRVGVGLILAAASMVSAAIVEAKRKHIAISNNLVDAIPMEEPLPISVFWLSFQVFIFGVADLFTFIGLLEFFYSQVPDDIKAVSSCFLWTSNGIGYFLSSILVNVVNEVTKNKTKSRGWLAGNNLNRVHLDLFYWLLAALTLLDFVMFLFLAKRYVYRK